MRLAAERRAARRQRTGRIRKAVAVVAAAAFIGPLGFIYGHDASTKSSTVAAATTTAQPATTTSTTSSNTTSPAPTAVTTQQS